jgi:DNA-binding transcriptional MerR regulator
MRNEMLAGVLGEGSSSRREFTISDMASLYGVSLRTLRFYEDKGLIYPRRQGTARYYSPNDRIRLELILKGKRLGFSLSEIHNLIASRTTASPEDDTADLVVSLNSDQVAAQIAHLERQRDDLTTAIAELREAHGRMCEPVS